MDIAVKRRIFAVLKDLNDYTNSKKEHKDEELEYTRVEIREFYKKDDSVEIYNLDNNVGIIMQTTELIGRLLMGKVYIVNIDKLKPYIMDENM